MVKLLSYDLPSYAHCSGSFIILADDKEWYFKSGCLQTGGSVSFDENWTEDVEEGPWMISEWPQDFPENLKWEVLGIINDELPWGCCGGCV